MSLNRDEFLSFVVFCGGAVVAVIVSFGLYDKFVLWTFVIDVVNEQQLIFCTMEDISLSNDP